MDPALFKALSASEQDEIRTFLANSKHNPPELEDMWAMMDLVWNDIGCNSREFDEKKFTAFYEHSVWLLNGFFIEHHELSMQHRHAISGWIAQHRSSTRTILDYGGGFGTLARLIAEKVPDVVVDIYEPHPNTYAVKKLEPYPNVNFVDSINHYYDCLISTDVLEHVPDPLQVLSKMIDAVRDGGYLVIANCFYPVIKCHLPKTFHLRYTFNLFASLMGLIKIGPCPGSHATIYQKEHVERIAWRKIRIVENLSRVSFLLLSLCASLIGLQRGHK